VLLSAIGLRLGWLGKPAASQIPWLHDEHAALQMAQLTGKPLLVDFSAEWCAACKELDESTFSDPTVKQTVADRFVPLKVDATEETDEVVRLEDKYGVPGLPTVLMMACNEPKPVQCAVPQKGPGRISGYVPPAEMMERMRAVQ
jgi:thiol:disulfide interchange protein DsbD